MQSEPDLEKKDQNKQIKQVCLFYRKMVKGRKYPIWVRRRVSISLSNYNILMVRKIFFPDTFEIDIGDMKIPVKQIDLNPPPKQTQNSLLNS